MKRVRTLLTALFVLGIYGRAAAEEIKVEGGTAAISVVFSPIKEAYENKTGDTLTIILTDPSKALVSLEKGAVDMVSINTISLEPALGKAKQLGVEIDPSTLVKTPITNASRLAVFLHKSNPVSQLSKEQLKGIFTGKITNWREVGGDDRKIAVYWSKETPYLNMLFAKEVLGGEAVTADAIPGGNHFNLRTIAITTPGAIVINTNGLVTPNLKAPEIPLMTLPIIAVTKGKPQPKVQKVLDFYREEYGYLDE
jgi:phosphate transport system substrate-binding protein